MTLVYEVAAFTFAQHVGNPAGVVLLDAPADAGWMQAVAAEMNLAETAFVHPPVDGQHPLRWFTPVAEVPLCGHATLASAHLLWEQGATADEVLRFATLSGPLTARRHGEQIVLDLPAAHPPRQPLPEAVHAHLAQPVVDAALMAGFAGKDAWLVELADEAAVRAYAMNDDALLATGIGGLVLTAPADPATIQQTGAQIVSRVLLPGIGISEDPVTGAAHCALATHWAGRLGNSFIAFQASPRGGVLGVQLNGERVELSGQAVTTQTRTLAI